MMRANSAKNQKLAAVMAKPDTICFLTETLQFNLTNMIGEGTPMTIRDPQPARVMRYYRVRLR